MTHEDFVRLAKNCRDAQNRYFRGGRTEQQKREAMDYERRLDKAIAEELNPPQAGLFDQGTTEDAA